MGFDPNITEDISPSHKRLLNKVRSYWKDEFNLKSKVRMLTSPIKGYVVCAGFRVGGEDWISDYYGCDKVPTMKMMKSWLSRTGTQIKGKVDDGKKRVQVDK